eukprot:3286085-Amphidinium_carterae.2
MRCYTNRVSYDGHVFLELQRQRSDLFGHLRKLLAQPGIPCAGKEVAPPAPAVATEAHPPQNNTPQ